METKVELMVLPPGCNAVPESGAMWKGTTAGNPRIGDALASAASLVNGVASGNKVPGNGAGSPVLIPCCQRPVLGG